MRLLLALFLIASVLGQVGDPVGPLSQKGPPGQTPLSDIPLAHPHSEVQRSIWASKDKALIYAGRYCDEENAFIQCFRINGRTTTTLSVFPKASNFERVLLNGDEVKWQLQTTKEEFHQKPTDQIQFSMAGQWITTYIILINAPPPAKGHDEIVTVIFPGAASYHVHHARDSK